MFSLADTDRPLGAKKLVRRTQVPPCCITPEPCCLTPEPGMLPVAGNRF